MRAALVGLAGVLAMAPPAWAASCAPDARTHAVPVAGEVAGTQWFTQPLPNGWVFALVPAPHGWLLRLYDDAPVEDAVDLTAFTPPLRGPVNPRDLFGWHFRNAANDGPNTGDVNAPQDVRAFAIAPALAGTGGFRPSGGAHVPSPDDGIGRLTILDKGLADLEPGQRARLSYLRFDACLRWPKSEEERRAEADAQSLDFLDEEVEIFGSCGLDLARYALDAVLAPRVLGGNFDGDDAHDEAAQIRRRSDGARGLALCRAGTWMQIVGLEGTAGLRPGYVAQMEAWRVIPPDGREVAGYEGAPAWPDPDGDVLALERLEKELIILYRRNDAWHSQQVYRFVEP